MIVTLRVTMIVTDAPANIAYPLKGDSKQRVTEGRERMENSNCTSYEAQS